MKLHVTETYFDRVENKYVEKESIIERDDERARKLISACVAEELEEEELEDIPEESSESEEDAPKQRTRKSAKK